MRVKLSVHRNRLPPAAVLWSIPEDQINPGTTVSKLLQQIDEIIPLEADEWGFEDYIVEVDGFECMHFQPVGDVIKEGDVITVRPLQTPEIRGRKLSGRYQISANGQHLVDGVPFGRPLLRKPNRPRISIPPKKRALLIDDSTEDFSLDEASLQQLLLTNGEYDDQSVDVDVDDLRLAKKRKIGPLIAQFNAAFEAAGDNSEDEDDDDFNPEAEGDEEAESSEEEQDDADALNDEINDMENQVEEMENVLQCIEDEIEQLDDEVANKDGEQTQAFLGLGGKVPTRSLALQLQQSTRTDEDDEESSSSDDSDDDDESDESDSDSDSDSSSSSGSDSDSSSDSDSEMSVNKTVSKKTITATKTTIQSSTSTAQAAASQSVSESKTETPTKGQLHKAAPPGQGKSSTQLRNARRKRTTKLKDLIKKGILPERSTLDNLRAFEENGTVPTDKNVAQSSKASEYAEFQAQREKLLASLDSGGVDMQTLEPVDTTTGETFSETKKRALANDEAAAPSPPGKRARLDVASTRRMVLGSLGIRAPRTNQNDDKSKQRSVTDSLVNAKNIDDVAPESDAWKGKLRVTAIECVKEGVALIPPPYPFVQRWDPSQQLKSKKKKKAGRKSYGQQEYDAYDESAITIDPDTSEYLTLNYDEGAEENEHTGEAAEQSYDAFPFPPLPEDPSTLPDATPADCIPGAIITFKQYDLGESTNWQPVISAYLTAQINVVFQQPGEFEVTLASRDIPFKNVKYDDLGNRIPSRFHPNDDENDDEEYDDGIRVLNFTELIAPKLLAAALPIKAETPLPTAVLDVADSVVVAQEQVSDEDMDVILNNNLEATADLVITGKPIPDTAEGAGSDSDSDSDSDADSELIDDESDSSEDSDEGFSVPVKKEDRCVVS